MPSLLHLHCPLVPLCYSLAGWRLSIFRQNATLWNFFYCKTIPASCKSILELFHKKWCNFFRKPYIYNRRWEEKPPDSVLSNPPILLLLLLLSHGSVSASKVFGTLMRRYVSKCEDVSQSNPKNQSFVHDPCYIECFHSRRHADPALTSVVCTDQTLHCACPHPPPALSVCRWRITNSTPPTQARCTPTSSAARRGRTPPRAEKSSMTRRSSTASSTSCTSTWRVRLHFHDPLRNPAPLRYPSPNTIRLPMCDAELPVYLNMSHFPTKHPLGFYSAATVSQSSLLPLFCFFIHPAAAAHSPSGQKKKNLRRCCFIMVFYLHLRMRTRSALQGVTSTKHTTAG